jgi:hypothetical protein
MPLLSWLRNCTSTRSPQWDGFHICTWGGTTQVPSNTRLPRNPLEALSVPAEIWEHSL